MPPWKLFCELCFCFINENMPLIIDLCSSLLGFSLVGDVVCETFGKPPHSQLLELSLTSSIIWKRVNSNCFRNSNTFPTFAELHLQFRVRLNTFYVNRRTGPRVHIAVCRQFGVAEEMKVSVDHFYIGAIVRRCSGRRFIFRQFPVNKSN